MLNTKNIITALKFNNCNCRLYYPNPYTNGTESDKHLLIEDISGQVLECNTTCVNSILQFFAVVKNSKDIVIDPARRISFRPSKLLNLLLDGNHNFDPVVYEVCDFYYKRNVPYGWINYEPNGYSKFNLFKGYEPLKDVEKTYSLQNLPLKSGSRFINKYKQLGNKFDVELKNRCPEVHILLHNLIYKESNYHVFNFCVFIANALFGEKPVSMYCLFKGNTKDTNFPSQSAGAGKTTLANFFHKLFGYNGTDNPLKNKFNSDTYEKVIKGKFNTNLTNDLTIVEEASLKSFNRNYNDIKQLTSGSVSLNIEEKFKQARTVDSKSQYIFFTNEHKLMTLGSDNTDRRIILFEPNPITNSIKKVVIKKYKEFDTFLKKLNSEENVIEFFKLLYSIDLDSVQPQPCIDLETNAYLCWQNSLKNSINVDDLSEIENDIAKMCLSISNSQIEELIANSEKIHDVTIKEIPTETYLKTIEKIVYYLKKGIYCKDFIEFILKIQFQDSFDSKKTNSIIRSSFRELEEKQIIDCLFNESDPYGKRFHSNKKFPFKTFFQIYYLKKENTTQFLYDETNKNKLIEFTKVIQIINRFESVCSSKKEIKESELWHLLQTLENVLSN